MLTRPYENIELKEEKLVFPIILLGGMVILISLQIKRINFIDKRGRWKFLNLDPCLRITQGIMYKAT